MPKSDFGGRRLFRLETKASKQARVKRQDKGTQERHSGRVFKTQSEHLRDADHRMQLLWWQKQGGRKRRKAIEASFTEARCQFGFLFYLPQSGVVVGHPSPHDMTLEPFKNSSLYHKKFIFFLSIHILILKKILFR